MVRQIVQLACALAMNANLSGFVTGKIWQGQSKRLCVPGLNCYSCPAAVGACPLGSLQLALASGGVTALAYVCGILLLVGAILGRAVCGFMCPFGLIQDLINAPFRKIINANSHRRFWKPVKNMNYIVLFLFVCLFPLAAYASTGLGSPAFCKYICPAGTLQAGIPLVLLNDQLHDAVGMLFNWKIFILACMLIACTFIRRPFCRICPLGAIYGLFNKISVVGMAVDGSRCTRCGICTSGCPMQTECYAKACIRCGQCAKDCPTKAVKYTVLGKTYKNC